MKQSERSLKTCKQRHPLTRCFFEISDKGYFYHGFLSLNVVALIVSLRITRFSSWNRNFNSKPLWLIQQCSSIVGLSTWTLKIQFNVVARELHTARRLRALHCLTGSHALSRSTIDIEYNKKLGSGSRPCGGKDPHRMRIQGTVWRAPLLSVAQAQSGSSIRRLLEEVQQVV